MSDEVQNVHINTIYDKLRTMEESLQKLVERTHAQDTQIIETEARIEAVAASRNALSDAMERLERHIEDLKKPQPFGDWIKANGRGLLVVAALALGGPTGVSVVSNALEKGEERRYMQSNEALIERISDLEDQLEARDEP